MPQPANPTQLKSAIAFAALFVIIRVATKATVELGGLGVFLLVAALSGVTDMDAIALSSARESVEGALSPADASRAILVALCVNSTFKLSVTRTAGSRELYRAVLPALGAAALVAAVGAGMVK